MASTIDYPNVISTVLFVGKCNWNCDFCYNRNLGSNLHLLQSHDNNLQGNALLLVKEALLPVPQVSVTSVQTKVINGAINLIINIEAYGEKGRLEMSV